ncbi:MAG: hypothetical protein IT193_15825 [Propionibacteriaceae bacterium]|nr:hypothetical protein [Propionibacteriaceae bacterium]
MGDENQPETEIGAQHELTPSNARGAGGVLLVLGALASVVWWVLYAGMHLNFTILIVLGPLAVIAGFVLLASGNRLLK